VPKGNKNINTQGRKTKNFNNGNSFLELFSELLLQNAKEKNNNSAKRGAAMCFGVLISYMRY